MHLPGSPKSTKGFRPLRLGNDSTATMIPSNGAAPSTGYSNTEYMGAPAERVRTNRTAISNRRLEEGDAVPVLDRGITDEKFGLQGRRKRLGDRKEEELTGLGKLYYKLYNASIVVRYFIYLVPLSVLLAIPTIVGATMSKEAKEQNRIGGVLMVWFFSWFQIVWVSLWVGKLVAKALPYVFQTLMGVVSAGVKKYAVVIRNLEVPISLVLWAIASLVSFQPLMADATGRGWRDRVDVLLRAALVSTFILLAEKFLVQLISVNYHKRQFEQRIKDSKRHVRLLAILYEISRKMFPAYTEFKEEDYIIQQNIVDLLGKKSGSATPMRQFVGTVGVVGDKLTSALGNVAREVAGRKNVFNPNSAHSIVQEALRRKASSEALARRIWLSFVPEGSTALTSMDIMEVMGEENEQDAIEIFEALDSDDNGDISLDEMVLFVTHLSGEKKAVSKSMQDVDNAIGVLDNLLSTIVFIIVIFVFVAFNLSNFSTMLAAAGTMLLSLSFIFALTAQEVLACMILIFVKHPFDVGDLVEIDTIRLTVQHISLLYTVFKRVEDSKSSQIPNNVLNTKWIHNISRSKYMQERIKIQVDYDTTLDDVALLRNEIAMFVAENNRDFQKDFDIEITSVNDLDKLELKLEIKHKSNWSNEQLTLNRRNKFFCALVQACKKVPIYGPGRGYPPLGDVGKPMYTVAIPDELAGTYRDKAAEDKLAKRMDYVPPEEREDKKDDDKANETTIQPFPGLSPLHEALEKPDAGQPAVPETEAVTTGALGHHRTDSTTSNRFPSRMLSTTASLSQASTHTTTGRRRAGQGLHDNIGRITSNDSTMGHSTMNRYTSNASMAESSRLRPSMDHGSDPYSHTHELQNMPPPPAPSANPSVGSAQNIYRPPPPSSGPPGGYGMNEKRQ